MVRRDPTAYGLDVNLLPSFSLNDYGPEIDGFSAQALPPGWYAISVSTLQLGLLYSRWNLYAPFKDLSPVERVGRSFLIYHITYPTSAVDRTVILGPYAGDLDADDVGQASRSAVDREVGGRERGGDRYARRRRVTSRAAANRSSASRPTCMTPSSRAARVWAMTPAATCGCGRLMLDRC